MKLKDLMQGNTPNPDFAGIVQAEDFVLAISDGTATHPEEYLVAQEGITEHSGTLNPETAESRYMRSGANTAKTGNQRQFSLSGDIYAGDDFQDAVLDHAMKYGVGQAVVRDYVYFNLLTGKGEKGSISIMVEDDPSGAAGDNAAFSATLYTRGTPAVYEYEPKA